MTDRWQEYFESRGAFNREWLEMAVTHWGFHEILYGMIQRHCPPPARILDVGCGPGWSDLYLSSAGYDVTGIDNEPRLLSLASGLAERVGIPARFELGDAFDLAPYYGRFDLVYSCGVLEHFDRDVTIQLLLEQTKCAPRALIQIPTRFTAYADGITDERIYTIGELRRMVKEVGLRVEAAFGYGDVTARPTQILLRRLLPRGVWRMLQNWGYAYGIAVIGERKQ
jgi:SAM-dependent methyltransferase